MKLIFRPFSSKKYVIIELYINLFKRFGTNEQFTSRNPIEHYSTSQCILKYLWNTSKSWWKNGLIQQTTRAYESTQQWSRKTARNSSFPRVGCRKIWMHTKYLLTEVFTRIFNSQMIKNLRNMRTGKTILERNFFIPSRIPKHNSIYFSVESKGDTKSTV